MARLEGLRSKTPAQRLAAIEQALALEDGALAALGEAPALPIALADGMIENVVGTFELPLGIATNFIVDGREVLVPMAVEEPSVVAAASYMAKIARATGGFTTDVSAPVMRGQIQLLNVSDLQAAETALLAAESEIIAAANACDATLVSLGGGCQGIEVHQFPETLVGPMLVVHLLVDVRDAMGANAVNTMAETVSPMIERLSGGEARLRILSNLADRRMARATVRLKIKDLATGDFSGERVAQGFIEAFAFADVDPYRAATHNKGIMNGIDPVVLATGNDWRAIEAGAHAYAARDGRYRSLTHWSVQGDDLIGEIALPMAVGLVGGATKTHPAARAALALMNVKSAGELAGIIAAVGLAQNMAALRALSTEGIQRGHMALHARNLAIAAGAEGEQINRVAQAMVAGGEVTADGAKKAMKA